MTAKRDHIIISHWISAPDGWTLLIHGGAGQIRREATDAATDAGVRDALRLALEAGSALLAEGKSALDAVEAAVRLLEDDPYFNAGRGAVFTADGVNELDAAMMDGATRSAGAVSAITRTRNPVSLARAVMAKGPHVMLSGAGADRFAAEQGLEQVDPSWFRVEERWRQFEEMRDSGTFDVDLKYGTVGAVARDVQGHLAAATSTGGLTGKRWNRIGDSPVIGAGTWADDRGAATSCTGSGEHFIRAGAAHEISSRVRLADEPLGLAADAVMDDIGSLGGTGGVISIDGSGAGGWCFNTPGMYRGLATASGVLCVALYGDE
ncbi:beta-aspartyl-peptidase (threonine type) [Sphingomonas sp. YR710]|uniref:isoaspartyl peptidase/L-asparaginase family protein n=1 Tax=Sphingomonas sp. YR710 TaxID=1882773 RepID=UPI000891BED2|nr:isoaspartyl peptidase/L-asparaginase [Sphingomonas sp. YR710]SDC28371.1 beta-aspartyl-peptidase (threonine type) [Sphingomonas sp. YR710]